SGAPRALVAVQVARSLGAVDEARASARAALAVAVPLALLLGTLGAFLVAARTTRPIARLSAEARAIGPVSLAARLDVGRTAGEGDPVLLERLVSNLVENALRHGGAGVAVLVRPRDGAVEVAVLDRGPGFPAELAPRIFERFARGDASRARSTGGAGLGLAL